MAVAAIAFFVVTEPEKKMTMHYCRLLILKHREEGDGNKLSSPSLLQHHARK
jgi:hypothetical protein